MDKEKKLFVTFVLLFGFCLCLEAKQINPTTEVELLTQAKRFLQMEDPFILRVILGSILMGVSVRGYSVIEAIGLQSLITESYFAVIVKIMLTPLSLIVSFLINFWTLEKYKESSRRIG